MDEKAGGPRVDDLEAALAAASTGPRLGALLLELRHRAGRSLRELEAGSGLTEEALSGMFAGRRFPGEPGLVAFLRACGVPDGRSGPWLAACRRLDSGGLTAPESRPAVPAVPPTSAVPLSDRTVPFPDGTVPATPGAPPARSRTAGPPDLSVTVNDAARLVGEGRLDALISRVRAELRDELRTELLDELRGQAAAILDQARREARTLLDEAADRAAAHRAAEEDRLRAENEALRASLTTARRERTLAAGPPSLTGLLGVGNPRELDPERTWAVAGERLRVPIGLDAEGRPVELDLAASGHGPHGMIIGATGSGKSELLRSIVLGLAATHPPEALNVLLLEYMGSATFAGMERLPHVSAYVTLFDDLSRPERMYEALSGELMRRQEALRPAGDLTSLHGAGQGREEGAATSSGAPSGSPSALPGTPPGPALLIVVDEFSELLAVKPEFGELFASIGRHGAAMGVHLLLSSQRYEEARMRGLHERIGQRIVLRTRSAAESQAVLGVPDAYELPSGAGHGFFRRGTETPLWFRAVYASEPVPREPAGDPGAPAAPESLHEVIVRRLAGHGTEAYAIWQPPLEAPPSLAEVLPPLEVTPEHGLTTAGWEHRGRLTAVAGLVDRPFYHRRDPYWLDLSGPGGHVAVVGAQGSGKSTAIATIVASLALTHTPEEVRFHVLDLGGDGDGGGLAALGGLPHVAGVVGRSASEQVHRTVTEITALLERRERDGRGEGGGDGRAEVFLVVDDWPAFRAAFPSLEGAVTDLAARGLRYGVHLVAASGDWAGFPTEVRELLGTRLELRLADPAGSRLGARRAQSVPYDRPGRGLTGDGFHFLTALPVLDASGPPGEGPGRLADRVAQAWNGRTAPPARTPSGRAAVPEPPGPQEEAEPPILIGVEEDSQAPVYADFAADPHLLVLGDIGCGKSNLLRHLASAIIRRHEPARTRIVFVDYAHSLLEVADTQHQIGYAVHASSAASLAGDIHASLSRRLPPSGAPGGTPSWTGAELYVIVDDHQRVAAHDDPLRPLADLLPRAREIGLHLILARMVSGASRKLGGEVIRALRDTGTPCLLLGGAASAGIPGAEGPAEPLPPGRARYVHPEHGARLVRTPLHEPPPA
ncbi:type VII secretion protein EccCb [Actinomadura viridis]|uniref:type VII secretion protein EccCb n=1 Tax=Actinomadura viridis TaxID=58110 RepID=UPI0036AB2A43